MLLSLYYLVIIMSWLAIQNIYSCCALQHNCFVATSDSQVSQHHPEPPRTSSNLLEPPRNTQNLPEPPRTTKNFSENKQPWGSHSCVVAVVMLQLPWHKHKKFPFKKSKETSAASDWLLTAGAVNQMDRTMEKEPRWNFERCSSNCIRIIRQYRC